MTCASCGKRNPIGARYCIHCGAEQSLPTPIAAVVAAASMSRASRVQAANAAQAEPRDAAEIEAANQASASATGGDTATTRAHIAGASPAYAALPGRRGLAAALIAACIVIAVAVAAFVVLRMQGGLDAIEGHAPIDRGAGAPGSAIAPDHAAPGVAESSAIEAPSPPLPPVTSMEPPAGESTGSAGTPPSTDEARETSVEIRPLPPKPAPARTVRRARAEREAKAMTPAAPALPANPARAERADASTAVAAKAVAGDADRWRRMEEEASRCTREDFIARVVCGQRVRFRYCDGYWGKVTQCPANPAPERGQ
jgi:hypothetical protein